MFRSRSSRSVGPVAAAAFLTISGCGGGDEVAGVGSSEIVLSEASATVDGHSINGQTIHGDDRSGFVSFEAHLVDGHHGPAPGHQVRVEYDIPAMGMMRRTGTFMLHDDGTHGDVVPHDGIYCYGDVPGEYGCHGPDARPGEYHYDFCGIARDGRDSNHMKVEIVFVP